MKKGIHIHPLLLALVLFICVFGGAIIAVNRFGSAIESRLGQIIPVPTSGNISDTPSKKVRRITVMDETGGCIEVTPDGAVRVYKVCGDELDTAYRPQDPKYILELFTKVKALNTKKYMTKPVTGEYITLVIETDQGTETIYLPGTDQSGGSPDDIIHTIDNIVDDIPPPTPTPTLLPSATPSHSPSVSPTASPTNALTGTPTPTGLPQGPEGDPFTCVFDDNGTGKPYRVSNVVCSTEPIPAQ